MESEAKAITSEAVVDQPRTVGERLVSMDAYRGFVMLLMASEGLGIPEVAKKFPGSRLWDFLHYQTDHVQWIGCGLWDLIQPSFMFLVGVAMPFSLASRVAKGQSYGQMLRHAMIRSLILIAFGIFLRSMHRKQTYFTFEDVLTQIGLGYTFLFQLWNRPWKVQAAAAAGILVIYWLANVLYPLPPAGFDYASVGVPPTWEHLNGLSAHFDKNTNIAQAFDVWFLNLFPREKLFLFNGGGYLTLNFIPSLATMIFGLLAGGWLRTERPAMEKVKGLVIAGVAGLVVGWGLGLLGICPVVKRIWTPSWAIFAGGWTCLLLALFYWIVDVKNRRGWAFPLVVVGMNSIAMYFIAHVFRDLIESSLKINLGQDIFERLAGVYSPILEATVVLFVMWLIVYWMYRRKLFLRV